MNDWKIGTSAGGLTIVVSGDDEIVARPYCTERQSATDVARLIAAAPEMLALLRSARLIVEGAGHRDLSVKIWNLIAKAEGRDE
jgi:hypothetical protein